MSKILWSATFVLSRRGALTDTFPTAKILSSRLIRAESKAPSRSDTRALETRPSFRLLDVAAVGFFAVFSVAFRSAVSAAGFVGVFGFAVRALGTWPLFRLVDVVAMGFTFLVAFRSAVSTAGFVGGSGLRISLGCCGIFVCFCRLRAARKWKKRAKVSRFLCSWNCSQSCFQNFSSPFFFARAPFQVVLPK